MALLPRTPNPMRRHAAMQAALYHARQNRAVRLADQIANDIVYSASPPNPDAESGTEGDGRND